MLKVLDGYKVYGLCLIGIAAILVNHFSGQTIPGVQFNDADWLTNIWYLLGVMAGRNAMPDKKGII